MYGVSEGQTSQSTMKEFFGMFQVIFSTLRWSNYYTFYGQRGFEKFRKKVNVGRLPIPMRSIVFWL